MRGRVFFVFQHYEEQRTRIMNNQELTDQERIEEFKRRLAAALKRLLQEQSSTTGKDGSNEKPDQTRP
jgi:hypothetical protein